MPELSIRQSISAAVEEITVEKAEMAKIRAEKEAKEQELKEAHNREVVERITLGIHALAAHPEIEVRTVHFFREATRKERRVRKDDTFNMRKASKFDYYGKVLKLKSKLYIVDNLEGLDYIELKNTRHNSRSRSDSREFRLSLGGTVLGEVYDTKPSNPSYFENHGLGAATARGLAAAGVERYAFSHYSLDFHHDQAEIDGTIIDHLAAIENGARHAKVSHRFKKVVEDEKVEEDGYEDYVGVS